MNGNRHGKVDFRLMATIAIPAIIIVLGYLSVHPLFEIATTNPDSLQKTVSSQNTSSSQNTIPSQLRAASFECDQRTIDLALALKQNGWTYNMPQPKSPQAIWGNTDGRTTWWVGYWINKNNNDTSSIQPAKAPNGEYIGDHNGYSGWRRGGSPSWPTKIEWLCSDYGGVQPN